MWLHMNGVINSLDDVKSFERLKTTKTNAACSETAAHNNDPESLIRRGLCRQLRRSIIGRHYR